MAKPYLPCSIRRLDRAFTLIELLTVIAIIAILAAITMGLTTAAKNARVNSRGEAELRLLQTAIESYKADRGAYPPDHLLPQGSAARVNPSLNPLYYELIGMEATASGFRPRGADSSVPVLTPDQVQRVFGRRGFLNASADPSEPAATYLDPKDSAVWTGTIEGVERISILVTPFPWRARWPEPAPLSGVTPAAGMGRDPNPWRYVSTSPTNNPAGFDLWAEVYVGNEKRVFKNW